jgi:hypothetical protein
MRESTRAMLEGLLYLAVAVAAILAFLALPGCRHEALIAFHYHAAPRSAGCAGEVQVSTRPADGDHQTLDEILKELGDEFGPTRP